MPDPNPSERLAEIEARELGVIEEELARALYDENRDLEPAEASNQAARLLSLCPNLLAVVIEDIPWLLEREKKLRVALSTYADHSSWGVTRREDGSKRVEFLVVNEPWLVAEEALADSGEASGEAG